MKCGGQSLNLQVANRAIIVDIWWNKTVEDQAFKRIYRLGQTKETYLVRILAHGGIDERVAMLQEAKEIIVASALQDDKHKPHFSGEMQLRMLFSTEDSESLVHEMKREMEERRMQQDLEWN
jgi:SNF2 family DNA or RNA helicase